MFSWSGTDLKGNVGTALNGTTSFEIDSTPPIGSLKINDHANYTATPEVTVTFNAADFTARGRVPPEKMLLSLDGGQTYTEEPFARSKQVTFPLEGGVVLPNGKGTYKPIYVKFKDAVGNESKPIKNGIVLDTSGPPKSAPLLRRK